MTEAELDLVYAELRAIKPQVTRGDAQAWRRYLELSGLIAVELDEVVRTKLRRERTKKMEARMADEERPRLVEFTKALLKVQEKLEPVKKDGYNDHFDSKYAGLAATVAACRPLLVANGFVVVQTFSPSTPGTILITTELLHVSGESKSSDLLLPLTRNDPQAVGSAITYGRRFGLAALVGVVPDDDDDGNAASKPSGAPSPKPQASPGGSPSAPKPAPVTHFAKPTNGPAPVAGFGSGKGKTAAQLDDGSLDWYAKRARESLADPGKAKFHDKERLWLASLEAEMKLRAAGGVVDGPPPHGDEDAPF